MKQKSNTVKKLYVMITNWAKGRGKCCPLMGFYHAGFQIFISSTVFSHYQSSGLSNNFKITWPWNTTLLKTVIYYPGGETDVKITPFLQCAVLCASVICCDRQPRCLCMLPHVRTCWKPLVSIMWPDGNVTQEFVPKEDSHIVPAD